MAPADPIAEAVAACRRGNSDAFRVIVEANQRRALLFAARMVGSGAEAEEAVQAAFVRAFEKLDRFDASYPFFPWLRAIIRNECLRRLRRQGRELPLGSAGEEQARAASGESTLLLQQIAARLPPEQWQLLQLKHVEGLRYREIAERLAIPIGTVMSRLHAARARVRTLLEEET